MKFKGSLIVLALAAGLGILGAVTYSSADGQLADRNQLELADRNQLDAIDSDI
ncbi:hypothetical protein ABES25_02735 [Bacillus gobiensis]|uniref:hypothetical protein n=1 Tax=Bacillus gobiensis TaxID=1441095 RepID=UPI003D1E4FD9